MIRKKTHLAAGLLTVFIMSTGAVNAQETVNIGFLGALSGPDAGWGLPGLTGNQMFIDEVNADGGLDVCGTSYKLNMVTFDDEATGGRDLWQTAGDASGKSGGPSEPGDAIDQRRTDPYERGAYHRPR